MRLLALAVLSGFALSSCEAVSHLEAVDACLKRVEAVFPAAKGLSEKDISGDITGFGEVLPDGAFILGNPAPDGSSEWTCKGNAESRQIDEVSFKGEVKKPADPKVWSY